MRVFRLLSFIGFFATLVVYSPNVMVLQSIDGGGLTGYFAESCLVCACISACTVAAGTFCNQSFLACLQGRVGSRCVLCVYALGSCGFALTIFLQPVCGPYANVACAVLAGGTVAPACIVWTRVFHDAGLSSAIRTIAIAGGMSAVLNQAVSQLPATGVLVAYLALLALGIAYPCACHHVRLHECFGVGRPVEFASRHIDLKAYASVMAMPLIGMAISSFAMGVQPVFLFEGSIDAQRVGMIIGAVPLLAIARSSQKPMFSFIFQVVIPIATAAVLILYLVVPESVTSNAAFAAVYTFYAMVSGVAVAAAMAIANAREFPRSFVCATLLGVFCAMGLLGICLGASSTFLFDNNAAILVILTAVYGAATMLHGCMRSWRLTVTPSIDDIATECCYQMDAPVSVVCHESFNEKVARISSETGLSPREAQIIGYIGRGHSSAYVAKTLLISESTVYSHVRNIYKKLGVSCREELIQLLNGR